MQKKRLKTKICIGLIFLNLLIVLILGANMVYANTGVGYLYVGTSTPSYFEIGTGTSGTYGQVGYGNNSPGGIIYYVSKSGNDSNDGSQAHPWLTISKAASTMVAGDTVNVTTGTYNESVTPANSGNVTNGYITYQTQGTVAIDGTGISGKDSTGLVDIESKTYIIFNGFTIQNAEHGSNEMGMFLAQDDHITLQNLTINGTSSSGIGVVDTLWGYSYNCTNITVDTVNISNTNAGNTQENLSFSGVSGFEIKNCTINDNSSTNQFVGIDLKDGCQNGSVHNNNISGGSHNGYGIYLDAHNVNSSSINIYANYIHNFSGLVFGIGVDDEVGGHTVSSVSIYNNILTGCYRGIVLNASGNSETYNNVVLINNTLYNNGSVTEFWANGGTYNSGDVLRNNIIYNTLGAVLISGFGSWTQDHNLTTNPSFSNGSGSYSLASDFSILPTSAAIDAGSSSLAPTTDYAGNVRPQGGGFDIGAYEYGGSSGSLPAVTTGSATPVGTSTTTIGEQVTNTGGSAVTSWGTNYGQTTSYGSTATNSGTHASSFSWSDSLTGLNSATLYHYQGWANNSTGQGTGSDGSFFTLPATPTSLSLVAGNGLVNCQWQNATGGSGTTVTTRIVYKIGSYPSSYSDGTVGIDWTSSTSGSIGSLTNGTTYYFAAFSKAVNGSYTSYSISSSTGIATPSVSTPSPVPPSGGTPFSVASSAMAFTPFIFAIAMLYLIMKTNNITYALIFIALAFLGTFMLFMIFH